jgi:DNA-binding transcriptional ArsR family regulator
MLDQLRHDIQTRLDELLSEAEKLRHALAALTSRHGATAPKTIRSSSTTRSRRRAQPAPATASRKPARSRQTAKSQTTTDVAPPKPEDSQATTPVKGASRAPARTAPGATKAAVLTALANGRAMTAGEVANATGLGRATVSTTLSKLTKTGELTKAARGYVIAGQTNTDKAVRADSGAEDGQPGT